MRGIFAAGSLSETFEAARRTFDIFLDIIHHEPHDFDNIIISLLVMFLFFSSLRILAFDFCVCITTY